MAIPRKSERQNTTNIIYFTHVYVYLPLYSPDTINAATIIDPIYTGKVMPEYESTHDLKHCAKST